jgi:flagellar motor switch protein FliN/FliY
MARTDTALSTDILPDIADSGAAPSPLARPRLESVLDVPVKVSAVLGKKRMSVAELMALGPGAVIELDRRVGEPIDLYINDTLIARGELVLVDGVLGVTMTEIVRASEG